MPYSTTVGVDLAKNVIQISVVSGRGKELSNRSLTRKKFAEFLGKQKPSLVAFESCASAHYWARAAQRHGHEARIIPAKAVAPFRQGHKTDSNDALAVAEAARRPNIKDAPMGGSRAAAEYQGRTDEDGGAARAAGSASFTRAADPGEHGVVEPPAGAADGVWHRHPEGFCFVVQGGAGDPRGWRE
jgi:hypothetical protein